MPPNTVYVGRGSKWGNPFKGKRAVPLFISWLDYNFDLTPYKNELAFMPDEHYRDNLLVNLHTLKGKNLCCWCAKDKPCHADVLLNIANKKGGEK